MASAILACCAPETVSATRVVLSDKQTVEDHRQEQERQIER